MNVLIRASESRVELVATNLEVASKATIRAKVDQTGSFTVPAKMLLDYILLTQDESIEISQVENEILVACGSAKTKIKGAPADEFPIMPEVEETHGYAIDAGTLKKALSQTVVAVAKNEIRPELAGIYCRFFPEQHEGLVLAATDSYRLAEKKIAVEQGKDAVDCIIPARTVFEMIRLLSSSKDGQAESSARVWVGDAQIGMRFSDVELTSRLVDGTYPDYTQIIPSEFQTTGTAPADVLTKQIKAASLFSTTGVNGVSFDLSSEQNTISVSSTSAQTGEHSSIIDGEIDGEENSILLNFRYVLEGLQQLDGDVSFRLNGPDAPCLFKEKAQDSYLYIVMPIRQ